MPHTSLKRAANSLIGFNGRMLPPLVNRCQHSASCHSGGRRLPHRGHRFRRTPQWPLAPRRDLRTASGLPKWTTSYL
jgi:hypothetical protein